jgi:hypothetical protein
MSDFNARAELHRVEMAHRNWGQSLPTSPRMVHVGTVAECVTKVMGKRDPDRRELISRALNRFHGRALARIGFGVAFELGGRGFIHPRHWDRHAPRNPSSGLLFVSQWSASELRYLALPAAA